MDTLQSQKNLIDIQLDPDSGDFVLRTEHWIPAPIERVFSFFSLETNLERITPDFLGFKVLGKSTPEIQEGTLIDYRLKLHGIPLKWRTRIEEWVPGKCFVDRQLRGPYRLWHHRHEFKKETRALGGQSIEGTLMSDTVRFRLPLGSIGRWVAGAWVRRDVRQIFEYRRGVITQLFSKTENRVE